MLLEEARVEILKHVKSNTQKVSCFSGISWHLICTWHFFIIGLFAYKVDVSGPYECISQTIAQAEEELGPVFLLVNCAGYAKAARFEDTTIEDMQV